VETATANVLHDYVDVVVRFEGLDEIDAVLVLEFLHEHDFATHTAAPVFIHQLGLVVDLRGVGLTFRPFVGQSHDSIGAFSEHAPKLVILVDLCLAAMCRWGR